MTHQKYLCRECSSFELAEAGEDLLSLSWALGVHPQ